MKWICRTVDTEQLAAVRTTPSIAFVYGLSPVLYERPTVAVLTTPAQLTVEVVEQV
jgi:hypothetical protein